MADYGLLSSPTDIYKKPSSSIFGSPKLFTGFALKGFTDSESISPTSVLDSKPFSAFKSPFWSDICCNNSPRSPKPENNKHFDILETRGVGLGLVDALSDEISNPKLSKQESRMVLFGSQLKIQIPSLSPFVLSSSADSPISPGDFGTRTRNSPLGLLSPSSKSSPSGSSNSALENLNSPRNFPGTITTEELELSEDYTCVISHGPNPRTTHIFDDCIIESCCGFDGFSASLKRDKSFGGGQSLSYPSESFLSFCYNCKKNLGQGKDIYIYRGEKAFCSHECRENEIMAEEESEKSSDISGI